MTIWDYAEAETNRINASTRSVEPAILEKYKQELAEDYQKYAIEERKRIAQTVVASQRIVIA